MPQESILEMCAWHGLSHFLTTLQAKLAAANRRRDGEARAKEETDRKDRELQAKLDKRREEMAAKQAADATAEAKLVGPCLGLIL